MNEKVKEHAQKGEFISMNVLIIPGFPGIRD